MSASPQSFIDELSGDCFACGSANAQGLHLRFAIAGNTATATLTLTRLHAGAPGYLHGGIIATLLDEAMSKLNRPLGVIAMTRNLTVDYLRPSPIDTVLDLTATHSRREGRKLFHTATLSHNGVLLARAEGLFVVVKTSS